MTLDLPLYQVDAFASAPFEGNPAAVCPLESWLPDTLMQAIALENQLSETAFVVREGDAFHIRWFTPTDEVDLCGHATLATAHVLLEELGVGDERLHFTSQSGDLFVERSAERLVLDFPSRPAGEPIEDAGLLAALGLESVREVRPGPYWMVVLDDEAALHDLEPDMPALASREPLIVTAPGSGEFDFVSRFFCPGLGIPEDPVTGSAHCTSAPYWAERLGRSKLLARQASARGGTVHCEVVGDRVRVGGDCLLYLRGRIQVPTP